MKILKKILFLLLIVFIIAQFFGPDRNEGDMASIDAFIADTNPPNEVHSILKNACFDCHSDVTRYPWYNKITPVNYWLADHIEHGKGHFDVSAWESYSVKKKDHKLDELIEMVEAKEMPLPSYTWTHGDAKLSDEQINSIVAWAKSVRSKYSAELKSE
ncbi:heme-binding domain-containing protein [Psychroserpens sp. SPM9]|uniref:heme-binding domain-containing protein n=1 Tax=Psychroserpens sp. SPM9 TaxID=2975598 RepID=UPI0021A31B93|nr:heme-binding domain-containing protein [Psychroserpens sp. SPM9]MDG5492093.1 heme-binding domain-containing protein [Psychroserpens sp. SPM9]